MKKNLQNTKSLNEQESRQEFAKRLWNETMAGIVSTAALMKLSGQRAYNRSYGRVYSKYTPLEIHRMRTAGTPVRNPKQAADITARHDAWMAKRFGQING